MSTSNPYGPPAASSGQSHAAHGPTPGPSLDFGRALSFFFQDPKWISKLLMGSLFTILSFVFVGGIFIAGYALRLIRRSSQGESYPLPEWDDLGGMFVEGLQAMGAYLAHLFPVIVLMTVLMVPIVVAGNSPDDPSPAMLLVTLPLMTLISLGMMAMLLYFPAALTRLAVDERMGAAFELGNNWAFLRRNVSNYLLAIVVFMVANFISQLGILLFCIGIIPASFWGVCAGAYALGEVALRDPENTAAKPA
jgi:hypothetical protein